MRAGTWVVLGWVAAAAVTTAVSFSAVSVVRTAVVPARPAVQSAIGDTGAPSSTAAGPTPSASPSRSASPGSQPPVTKVFTGTGGSVVVQCAGDVPRFLNVTPRQGYTARPDDEPNGEIRFESETNRTRIEVSCTDGVPRGSVREDPRDGDGGNSGPG